MQALANLITLCKTCLPDRYEMGAVDMLKPPKLALEDNVLMAPALRIIGSLSQVQVVLDTLKLQVVAK